jgi:hypothetical protein
MKGNQERESTILKKPGALEREAKAQNLRPKMEHKNTRPGTLRLHSPGWAVGGDHRREPPQGVHGRGHHAWQPTTLRQTPGPRRDGHAGRCPPRQSSCHQAGLIRRPTGIFTITAGAAENLPQELFFSYPTGSFLHAPGWQLLRSLHKSSNASGNRLRGSISYLVHSSPETSARGELCGGYLRPWFVANPRMATVLRTPAPLYPVYSPCI